MANGPLLTFPCSPNAAAVVSEPMVDARYTPKFQLNARYNNGMVPALRPPKMKALIRTPSGFSQSLSIEGHWEAGAVNRELGCATGAPLAGSCIFPRQLMTPSGGCSVNPSHHTSPSGVTPTFVKMLLALMAAIAFGFVFSLVPGATPKYPYSGLIAYK